HRLERCLSTADRVIAMADGRIVCDAPPEEFLVWASACAPELATPGARLLSGLGLRPVAGVKAARAALRVNGIDAPSETDAVDRTRQTELVDRSHGRGDDPALRFDRVWHEVAHGPAILRSASLRIGPTERVALMGRNGAGKSTLLRHAAGLMRPTRGRIQRA